MSTTLIRPYSEEISDFAEDEKKVFAEEDEESKEDRAMVTLDNRLAESVRKAMTRWVTIRAPVHSNNYEEPRWSASFLPRIPVPRNVLQIMTDQELIRFFPDIKYREEEDSRKCPTCMQPVPMLWNPFGCNLPIPKNMSLGNIIASVVYGRERLAESVKLRTRVTKERWTRAKRRALRTRERREKAEVDTTVQKEGERSPTLLRGRKRGPSTSGRKRTLRSHDTQEQCVENSKSDLEKLIEATYYG